MSLSSWSLLVLCVWFRWFGLFFSCLLKYILLKLKANKGYAGALRERASTKASNKQWQNCKNPRNTKQIERDGLQELYGVG